MDLTSLNEWFAAIVDMLISGDYLACMGRHFVIRLQLCAERII